MCVCVCQATLAEGKSVEVDSCSFSEAPSRKDPTEPLRDVDGEEKAEVEQSDTNEEAEDDKEEVKPAKMNQTFF